MGPTKAHIKIFFSLVWLAKAVRKRNAKTPGNLSIALQQADASTIVGLKFLVFMAVLVYLGRRLSK